MSGVKLAQRPRADVGEFYVKEKKTYGALLNHFCKRHCFEIDLWSIHIVRGYTDDSEFCVL
jgi:hypothetical protein